MTTPAMQPTSSASSAANWVKDLREWFAEYSEIGIDDINPACIEYQKAMHAWYAALVSVGATIVPQVVQAPIDSPTMTYATFQDRVQPWMMECFGAEISADRMERNHRFFEESTELVQANGMTRSEAHQLVDYTFDRPVGELNQEVGGVMVTLAALCLASKTNMHIAGEVELCRIWTMVDKIRAKQAAKPAHSPLPVAAPIVATVPSEQKPVGYVDGIWLHGRQKDMPWNAKVFHEPTGDATSAIYAAPSTAEQASDVRNAAIGEVSSALSRSIEASIFEREILPVIDDLKSATADKGNAPAEAKGNQS